MSWTLATHTHTPEQSHWVTLLPHLTGPSSEIPFAISQMPTIA